MDGALAVKLLRMYLFLFWVWLPRIWSGWLESVYAGKEDDTYQYDTLGYQGGFQKTPWMGTFYLYLLEKYTPADLN